MTTKITHEFATIFLLAGSTLPEMRQFATANISNNIINSNNKWKTDDDALMRSNVFNVVVAVAVAVAFPSFSDNGEFFLSLAAKNKCASKFYIVTL